MNEMKKCVKSNFFFFFLMTKIGALKYLRGEIKHKIDKLKLKEKVLKRDY